MATSREPSANTVTAAKEIVDHLDTITQQARDNAKKNTLDPLHEFARLVQERLKLYHVSLNDVLRHPDALRIFQSSERLSKLMLHYQVIRETTESVFNHRNELWAQAEKEAQAQKPTEEQARQQGMEQGIAFLNIIRGKFHQNGFHLSDVDNYPDVAQFFKSGRLMGAMSLYQSFKLHQENKKEPVILNAADNKEQVVLNAANEVYNKRKAMLKSAIHLAHGDKNKTVALFTYFVISLLKSNGVSLDDIHNNDKARKIFQDSNSLTLAAHLAKHLQSPKEPLAQNQETIGPKPAPPSFFEEKAKQLAAQHMREGLLTQIGGKEKNEAQLEERMQEILNNPNSVNDRELINAAHQLQSMKGHGVLDVYNKELEEIRQKAPEPKDSPKPNESSDEVKHRHI